MTRTSPIQTSFSSGELSPLLYGRVDYQRFQSGLRLCNGFLPLRQGGFTRAPGTTHEGQTRFNRRARLLSFEFAVDDSLLIELTANVTSAPESEPAGGTMRFWRYGVLIEKDGAPYELQVPYDQASIDVLQWVQSADVIYLVDGLRPIQRLERRALNDWSIESFEIDDGPFALTNLDKNVSVQVKAPDAGSAFPSEYLFTEEGDAVDLHATDNVFNSGMNGSLFQIEPFENRNLTRWTSNTNYGPGDVVRSGSNYYRSLTSNASKQTPPTHTEGQETIGGHLWEYLSDDRGVVRITNVMNPRFARAVVVRPIPLPCTEEPSYRWSKAAWSTASGYPSSIAIYDQRLVAAATPRDPRTVWFSAIGSFSQFGGNTEADDAFAYEVSGSTSLNRIIWLETGRRGLHVGALGQEYSIRSNSSSQAIGPTTFELGGDSSIGSHQAMAIAPDGKPIFISKDQRRIFEMRYAFEQDASLPIELSLPAEHLGQLGFEELAWQAAEQRMAWIRLRNGNLAGMIHDPQEDVLGWSTLSLAGGHVESMATYSDPATSRDILTVVVQRNVNGETVRHLERFAPLFGLGGDDARAAHHLYDAQRFAPATPQDTFMVPHLAGQTVLAWTEEGNSIELTVGNDGTVTLPSAVNVALIGLLDRTHVVETLPVRAQARDGDTTGRQLRLLPGHGVRVHRSSAGTVSAVERDVVRGKHVSAPVPLVPTTVADTGQTLFSGVTAIEAKSGQSKECNFEFRPMGGAPLTVLTITSMIDEAGG